MNEKKKRTQSLFDETGLRSFQAQSEEWHSIASQLVLRLMGLNSSSLTPRETLQATFKALKNMEDDPDSINAHLWRNGWCLSGRMTPGQVLALQKAFREENFKEIDSFIVNFARRHATEIISDACDTFPDRKAILEDVLTAHNTKMYTLSIPVLLAQTDGMCRSEFKALRFGKKKARDELFKTIKQLPPMAFSRILLLPLCSKGPVEKGGNFDNIPDGLDRHFVLHGVSTNYNTEINSLKCIMLLDCVVSAAKCFRRESESREEHDRLRDRLKELDGCEYSA